MNVYLVNTTTNSIVGRFESVTDAEIAGEMLLGTDGYYVGDADDLTKGWKVVELFKLAKSVGEDAKDWNFKAKAWCVSRLVELADAFDFAPPAPSKPEPAPKAEKAPRQPRDPSGRPNPNGACGKAWAVYDGLAAGTSRKDAIAAAVATGINPATAATQYQRWTKRG